MIEIDANGVPRDLRAMDAGALLDHAAHAIITRRVADRTRLRLAADWARRHPAGAADKATWAEVDRRLGDLEIGAEGCPGIAPGAVAPLGAALGLSTRSAVILVEDALDLTFRLPRLGARVEALAVEVSKARQVARLTHSLSAEAAAWVDAQIGARVAEKSWKAIEETVAAAIHLFCPELAEELARRGKAGWHVEVQHPGYVDFAGTSHLDASGDSLDLEDFIAAVNQVAAQLGADGDPDTLDQRKAKALGILGRQATGRPAHPTAVDPATEFTPDAAAPQDPADPDATPDGLFGDPAKPEAPSPGSTKPGSTKPGSTKPGSTKGGAPRPGRRNRSRRPIIVRAYLSDQTAADPTTHTTETSTTGGSPTLYELPGYGIVAESVFAYWCTTHDVRAARVIDLHATTAVDAHDPPEWMRTVVQERDRHCVFPHCAVDAELCDLDHIKAYDPHGPPGQTSPDHLACLCRRHHLLKTHAGWTYTRAPDGTYTWTSPHHRHYLRDTDGITHNLGDAA